MNGDRTILLNALVAPEHRLTEANIQAAVRDLLVHGGLDLTDVDLETRAGTGRIDVEVGATVIEVKKDLTTARRIDEAADQLAGYLAERQTSRGTRYVGVLTDGVRWSAWHLPPDTGAATQVDTFAVPNGADLNDLDRLLVWLDGLMATTQAVTPTALDVERRLGADSSATRLDLATLTGLLATAEDSASVTLKRQLWRRLLTVASGVAVDDEDDTLLFIEHTYLTVLAELIGHAVLGYDLTAQDPEGLLRGRLFVDAGVYGVIEQDFFDWVGDVEGGVQWVADLARRVGRFDWARVEHDVLKVLYESVIGRDTRHRLGEYYTPDWLARSIVHEVVDDAARQKVLDPACGSGTFLFWAVRHALETLEAAGVPAGEAIARATRQVFGVDVHPVAVTLARITYLLAIGTDRLTSPRDPFSVPVYLGDSVQFEEAEGQLWSSNGLVVHAAATEEHVGQGRLDVYAQELKIPQRVLDDVGTFDRLLTDLTHAACNRAAGGPRPRVGPILDRHGIHPDDKPVLTETFRTLCDLNDDGRNHIWGYYLRNLARPRWLAQQANRVDRMVGNPPWLAYRHMPDAMQARFRTLSVQRGLWAGGQVANQTDLSALFLARTAEQYLKPDGRFGLVMPFATLSRQAYAGFRTGRWTPENEQVGAALTTVTFDHPWQLVDVTPDIFPVPSSVVLGTRNSADASYGAMPATAVAWEGEQPDDPTEDPFHRTDVPLVPVPSADDDWSPYHPRFFQGASVVPRALTCVEPQEPGPLGSVSGQTRVVAARSSNEKAPWKDVETLSGRIEDRFLRPLHLGSTLLPFRLGAPWTAIVPWDGDQLLEAQDRTVQRWPGLADWMVKAEDVWQQHRPRNSPPTLTARADYQRGLTNQFEVMDRPRVIYPKSGSTMAAAILTDPTAVVDYTLYWAAAASMDEARYLCAILNAPATTERVRPLQSVGAFGPRDFVKWVWALPIPHFEPGNQIHAALVKACVEAEQVSVVVDVAQVRYPRNRGVVREALVHSGVMDRLDELVNALLLQGAAAREERRRG